MHEKTKENNIHNAEIESQKQLTFYKEKYETDMKLQMKNKKQEMN